MRLAQIAARGLALAAAVLTLSASKLPSAQDGYRDGAISNGHQNMPVHLVGVSGDWDRACFKGDSAQCLRLADAFETGLGDLRAEPRVALGYYLKACDQGAGPGCFRAAAMIREGEAAFTDPALAFKTAERGCTQLKNQGACSALGVAYWRGAGAPKDPAQAIRLWDQACAAGEDEGCRLKAGELFWGGGDPAQAVPIFQRACDQSRAWGCNGVAHALRGAKGTARDLKRAAEVAQKGCLQGTGDRVGACALYALQLVRSDDKATLNKGEKLLDRACMARDGFSCLQLGTIGFDQWPNATTTRLEGLYYFRHACDLGQAQGCMGLSKAYDRGVDQVEADPAIAFALVEKACTLGDGDACARVKRQPDLEAFHAARPAIDPTAPAEEQIRLAREAVEHGGNRLEGVKAVFRLVHEGDEEAEWIAGGWLYYGLPGIIEPPNRHDGLISIENAARVGHADAAVFMGMAYWYGQGVAQDRAKGEDYMAIAAQRGSEKAAAIWRSMKAEPIRQENARRQKEAEEYAAAHAAEREQEAAWQAHLAAWRSSWASPSPPSWTSSNSSWQSTQSIMETGRFNQFISYMSGGTSVCPSYNHYC